MRAHTPPAPSPPTPHPTPTWPLPTPGLHFLGVLRVSALTAHTPPHPYLATTHTWLAFPRCLGVFKGCQCVPTPPRALTAHTPPHPYLATTHTWLAFPRCFESILKAANACPHPPAPSPPTPHPTPTWPLPTPGLHFLGVLRVFKGCQCPCPHPPAALTAHTPPHPYLATTHTWLAFPRCFESI